MFNSHPQYNLIKCSLFGIWYNFPDPSKIPEEVDKVWKITLSVTNEGARIIYHCNDVEVLNVLTSASTCQDGTWNNYWTSSMNVGKLHFASADKASDFYSFQPTPSLGNILMLFLQILTVALVMP